MRHALLLAAVLLAIAVPALAEVFPCCPHPPVWVWKSFSVRAPSSVTLTTASEAEAFAAKLKIDIGPSSVIELRTVHGDYLVLYRVNGDAGIDDDVEPYWLASFDTLEEALVEYANHPDAGLVKAFDGRFLVYWRTRPK